MFRLFSWLQIPPRLRSSVDTMQFDRESFLSQLRLEGAFAFHDPSTRDLVRSNTSIFQALRPPTLPNVYRPSLTMMQESSSPFDDAMARPLMDEPVKKRWSWFQSSERSKLAREGFYGNDPEDSDSEEGYNAPGAIQEIDFVSDSDDESEDGQLVLSRLEGGTAFELAILEERRQGISDINLEMRQINEIQKGMSSSTGRVWIRVRRAFAFLTLVSFLCHRLGDDRSSARRRH